LEVISNNTAARHAYLCQPPASTVKAENFLDLNLLCKALTVGSEGVGGPQDRDQVTERGG
jgi:hypothetical protein